MRHDKQSNPFYRTKAWKLARQEALARDNYLCQRCLDNEILTAAEMVHHVKPIETHPSLALVLGNLLSLCNACHNATHSKGKRFTNKKSEQERTTRARVIDV